VALKIEVRRTPSSGAERWGGRRARWRSWGMSRAAGRIAPATRLARENTAYRINGAREWSAPQFQQAADYVDNRLGPQISSFLSATASLLEPSRPSHRSRNTALMTLGLISLIGVLGALATRRGTIRVTTRSRDEEMMEQPSATPTPMQSRPFSEGRLHTT
jgi:hypothetical protein